MNWRIKAGIVSGWGILQIISLISCAKNEAPLPKPLFQSNTGRWTASLYVPEDEPASVGSYTIVISAAGKEVQRIASNRDGTVIQMWIVDLARDGITDIVVWTQSTGSGSYGVLDLYQHTKGKFISMPMHDLEESHLIGYNGHDTYTIENDKILRAFPVYEEGDVNAEPTGGVRKLEYDLQKAFWISIE